MSFATLKPPVQLVIKKIGSVRGLANALGVTRNAVMQWNEVPLKHLLAVEKLTGIPREQLRPDLAKLFAHRRTQ